MIFTLRMFAVLCPPQEHWSGSRLTWLLIPSVFAFIFHHHNCAWRTHLESHNSPLHIFPEAVLNQVWVVFTLRAITVQFQCNWTQTKFQVWIIVFHMNCTLCQIKLLVWNLPELLKYVIITQMSLNIHLLIWMKLWVSDLIFNSFVFVTHAT